jgi:multiple sugar transport system substrate-binding protein
MTTTAVPDLYRSVFAKFMAENPGVRIDWRPIPAGKIRDVALSTIMANPNDLDVFAVMYGDLGAFAAARLTATLDGLAWAEELKKQLTPTALANGSFGGKLYGIPYFNAVHIFVYNTRFLEAAGTKVAPRTWAELTSVAKTLKSKGLFEYPIMWPMDVSTSADSIHWTWQIIAASWCKPLWTSDLKPQFLTPDSPGWKALQWLVDGMNKDQIIDPASLEMDPGKIMQLVGRAQLPMAFQTSPHELIRINSRGTSPEAGRFVATPAPEQGCSTVRTDAFVTTARARERGGRHWEAVETVMRWFSKPDNFAKPFGLTGRGWGFKSLNTDPDLRQNWGEWIDMPQWSRINQRLISYTQLNAHYSQPWFPELRDSINSEIQKAVLQKQSVEVTLRRIAAKADELSKRK